MIGVDVSTKSGKLDMIFCSTQITLEHLSLIFKSAVST